MRNTHVPCLQKPRAWPKERALTAHVCSSHTAQRSSFPDASLSCRCSNGGQGKLFCVRHPRRCRAALLCMSCMPFAASARTAWTAHHGQRQAALHLIISCCMAYQLLHGILTFPARLTPAQPFIICLEPQAPGARAGRAPRGAPSRRRTAARSARGTLPATARR